MSAHSSTSPPLVGTLLARAHFRNVTAATRGIVRSGAMSRIFFAIVLRPGVCVITFARPGEIDASCSHLSTMPNAYAWSGRVRPS